MTTLAADKYRSKGLGNVNEFPVIASEIIYEGAAVGLVKASGHAQPLAAGDRFVGFCQEKVDNSAGAAAALNVHTLMKGSVELAVTGAVITDVGQPVYATDDDTFTFIPTGAVFIGFMRRFVSAGVAIVEFDADNYEDPYAVFGSPEEYETVSGDKTLDIEDTGKVLFVDTDAKTITLPVVATGLYCTIVNIGAYGTVLVTVSPQAADGIHAPDIGFVNDKDHLNTKATAQRGDLVSIAPGDANAWLINNQRGVWAQQG